MEEKYFYRKIVDEIPSPVYVFQEGDFVFFNQAFVEYSGYSRSELTTIDFLDLIHPDHRNTLVAQTKLALSGKVDKLPQELEIQIIRKNGETRWVRIKPRLIDHNSEPAVLGVVIDTHNNS
jgi:PAS domain S-box-containing protein